MATEEHVGSRRVHSNATTPITMGNRENAGKRKMLLKEVMT